MAIATQNPATGETVQTFEAQTPDEVDAAIARADATFRELARAPRSQQRARLDARAPPTWSTPTTRRSPGS